MPKPRLLLTRPHPGAAQFLERLSPALRDGAVISPLIEIAPTGVGVDLAPFAGVIFTSANGVAHGPKGGTLPVYCVGEATAQAARAEAILADAPEPHQAAPQGSPYLPLNSLQIQPKLAPI